MRDLLEVERRYHSKLVNQIEPYAGKGYWIHFGETPKIGIRPSAYHSDPVGVYFYSIDWLLGHERFEEGRQYATNYPYWTIVKLNENPAGIVLSNLDQLKLREISSQQRWVDFPEYVKKQIATGYSQKFLTPRKLFWKYVTRFSKRANTPLKGIPYILDDGTGTIHHNEPVQLAVFDPRSYTIVASGNQYSGRATNEEEMFYNISSGLMKELRARYGGELTYQKDNPSLAISGKYSHFVIRTDNSHIDKRFTMEATWGHARKYISIGYHEVKKMAMSSVIEFFASVIDHIMTLGKRDLFFIPYLSVENAAKIIKRVSPKALISTEIDNSRASLTVSGETIYRDGELEIWTSVRANISKTGVDWSIDGKVKHSSNYGFLLSYRSSELDDIEKALRKELLEKTELHNPDSSLYRKFYDREAYEAFLGWVCVNAGIEALKSNQDWIEQYQKEDKSILMRDITRVYSRF